MSKVAFFWPYFPKFFRYAQNFLPPKNFSASPNFFTLLDLKILFLPFIDLKIVFLALKNLFFRPKKIFFRLFRPKNPFLDFLDLKISLNPLKTLRKHHLNLQIDEKNNISLDFIAKNYPSHNPP